MPALGGFGQEALKVLALAVDEVPHGLADRFDLLRRKCPPNGEVSLFVKPGDLTIVDVVKGVEIVGPSGRVVEGWFMYRDGRFAGYGFCHEMLLEIGAPCPPAALLSYRILHNFPPCVNTIGVHYVQTSSNSPEF